MNRFEELAQAARAAVRARQRRLPLEHLRELVRTAPPTLNATAVLRSRGQAHEHVLLAVDRLGPRFQRGLGGRRRRQPVDVADGLGDRKTHV